MKLYNVSSDLLAVSLFPFLHQHHKKFARKAIQNFDQNPQKISIKEAVFNKNGNEKETWYWVTNSICCYGSISDTWKNVARLKTDLMKEQLATFRSQHEEFAPKHKNDIRKNPTFRAQFHEMCAKVGVDPLASSKVFWAELLQIGDFCYELGLYNFFSHYGAISLANVLCLFCVSRKVQLVPSGSVDV